MNIEIRLTHDPLNMSEAASPGSGAVVRFTGVVRPDESGISIAALVYDAYEPMARKVIVEILNEIHKVSPLNEARVYHRLGRVPVGEAAIILEITSERRAAAFAAASEFMDRLKQDVPIWKVKAVEQ